MLFFVLFRRWEQRFKFACIAGWHYYPAHAFLFPDSFSRAAQKVMNDLDFHFSALLFEKNKCETILLHYNVCYCIFLRFLYIIFVRTVLEVKNGQIFLKTVYKNMPEYWLPRPEIHVSSFRHKDIIFPKIPEPTLIFKDMFINNIRTAEDLRVNCAASHYSLVSQSENV